MNPEAAFEEFKDKIQRYIISLVQDPMQAEDLLQETFLRVHRGWGSLRDPAALKAWLYQIATHVCWDHFRRLASPVASLLLDPEVDRLIESQEVNQDELGVESLVDRVEMSQCVQKLIHQLPETYRLVILLHDVHGLTNSETAQALGCPLDTAKIYLHRARRKLKEALLNACEFSHDERGVFVCEPKRPISKLTPAQFLVVPKKI